MDLIDFAQERTASDKLVLSRRGGLWLVRIPIALLLLTAAASKAHALFRGRVAEDALGSAPWLHLAAIELEVVLAFLLFTSGAVRVVWIAAGAFFLSAGALSLYQALDGQPSCACFGDFSVNPWLTCALDVVVVTSLVLSRPLGQSKEPSQFSFRGSVQTTLGAAVLVSLIGGGFFLFAHEPAHLLAQLRGEPIVADPLLTELGEGVSGEERTFTIHLRNLGATPLRIVGGTRSCSCNATGPLPVIIPALESKGFEIRVTFLGKPGRFRERFFLYAEEQDVPAISAFYAGRVIPRASP